MGPLQGYNPKLKFLKMIGDGVESMIYFIEQRCPWVYGSRVDRLDADTLPLTFQERVIGIPTLGCGPHLDTFWYDA